MASTLSDFEISLIKKMLETGWKNAAIQFYFNNPERPVNNGRISEIKGGNRGQNVPAATTYELEEFLDHHPLTLSRLGVDEPETPVQVTSATQFAVNDDQKLDVRVDPLSEEISSDPNLEEIYNELRGTAHELFAMGHNTLGDITPKIEAFAAALPEDSRDTSISRIWMRGNKLRMLLDAHDLVASNPDMHPAKLDVACAQAVRTVVQAFNVFTATSARASELDQLSLGPDTGHEVRDTIPEIEAVIREAASLSTDEAQDLLIEEIESAQTADATATGDRQVLFAGRSISNFFTTAIVRAYRIIRAQVGNAVSAVWTELKGRAVEATATVVLGSPAYGPVLMEFLKANFVAIGDFLTKVQANPAVQQFLEFIIKAL